MMSHNNNDNSNHRNHSTIEFRLLCSTTVAGAVIGRSGTVVKHLGRDSSSKIHLDDVVSSSCKERLIHVTGSPIPNRKFRLSDSDVVVVSAAQEGLLRVFDRMLEVVDPLVLVRCRLLVGPGLAGAVIGGGGKRINQVIQQTGCHIKVWHSNQLLPECALPSDELVQISGSSLAVKKGLVAVSRFIQQKAFQLNEGTNIATEVRPPSMNLRTGAAESNGGVKEQVAEVVFKLICSYDAAGAVIGFKGLKVRALEEETEASIIFSAPDHGRTERVVSVSAFENSKSLQSSAQNALVRVFNELMASGEMENVTARLLIHPSQIDCLNASMDSIISNISRATGATMQILEQIDAHAGATIDEKVIQIDGEYSSVQIALFQVSWMLRESVFGKILANINSPLLPHKMFHLAPHLNKTAVLTETMKSCKVSKEANGSLPSKARQIELPSGDCLSTRIPLKESTTVKSGPEHGSKSKSVIVTNTKMEIAVRADLFSSVFGNDDSKLCRLRTVSGATVEVQDHCPGNDRKVIISGTPDQTVAAQCLLQAYIMAAQ